MTDLEYRYTQAAKDELRERLADVRNHLQGILWASAISHLEDASEHETPHELIVKNVYTASDRLSEIEAILASGQPLRSRLASEQLRRVPK